MPRVHVVCRFLISLQASVRTRKDSDDGEAAPAMRIPGAVRGAGTF